MIHARRATGAFASLLLFAAASAHAVEIGSDGFGDVLLFPYFKASGDTQSLLTVTTRDRDASARAIRIAFRFPAQASGQRPAPLLVDLALPAADSWVAALAAIGEAPVLLSQDHSCARAASDGVVLEDGAVAGAGAAWSVPLADAEGWIEVFELGEIADAEVLGALSRSDGEDCLEFWARFDAAGEGGMASPDNRLRGSLHLVEVARASAYSLAPLALAGFRDRPMFAATIVDRPTLDDAEPPTARVVLADGEVVESSFATAPVDAVSAVLMAQAWELDFTVEAHAGAATDLVVTLPTRGWYVSGEDTRAPFAAHPHIAPGGAVEMRTRVFDREGHGLGSVPGTAAAKCTPVPQNVPRGPKLDGDISVFEFGPQGLLESAHGRTLLQWDENPGLSCRGFPWTVWEELESGRYAIRFDRAPDLDIGRLVSDEGHVHLGQPAIGAAFTRIRYDDFGAPGVTNSYGLVQPITRTQAVESPGAEN